MNDSWTPFFSVSIFLLFGKGWNNFGSKNYCWHTKREQGRLIKLSSSLNASVYSILSRTSFPPKLFVLRFIILDDLGVAKECSQKSSLLVAAWPRGEQWNSFVSLQLCMSCVARVCPFFWAHVDHQTSLEVGSQKQAKIVVLDTQMENKVIKMA